MDKAVRLLLLDGARGPDIPKAFAAAFTDRDVQVKGVDHEQWLVLEAGPDHPDYKSTWANIRDLAIVIDDEGICYHIHEDGDLWLIPSGMAWSEEAGDFVWPNEEEA